MKNGSFAQVLRTVALCALIAVGHVATAGAETATTNHIYISVANDTGVKYNNWDYSYYGDGGGAYTGAVGPNAYLIKGDGGGTNELKISATTLDGAVTNVDTTSNNPSGTFYLTNSGGRGFDNDLILAVAVKPPISDHFSVRIKSGGYTWTAAKPGNYSPPAPTDYVHVQGLDEVFTKADFIYGPQTGRPGTAGGGVTLPIFSSDLLMNTSAYLMFVDLNVGNIKSTTITGLQDDGAARVDFWFTGLDHPTQIAFNAYGWASAANQNEGISWTNAMAGAAQSGFYINASPTNTSYPTAEISYSPDRSYASGDVVTIAATFSEPMADTPVPAITLTGADTLGPVAMTKVDSTHYTYRYTAGSGNGQVAVSLSAGVNAAGGNAVTPTPTKGGIFTLDNVPPTVTLSATGAIGNVNVGSGAKILATFSKPVDPATVTPQTFYVDGIDGTLAWDDTTPNTAVFTPAAPGLAKETTYRAVVTGVKDFAGNLLTPSPTEWIFSTTGALDTTPPTAYLKYAPSGPYQAGTAVTITAIFSEAMAATPVPQVALSGAATLAATDMTRLAPGTYTYSYTVGAGDGTVNVSLSAGTDLAFNPLVPTPTNNTASFVIDNTAPTATFSPADGSSDVPVDTLIKATFNEPIDPYWIAGSSTFDMAGNVTFDAATNTVILTPRDTLGPGLPYTISVQGVRDLAGNVMAPATVSFTTSGAPDTVPPTAALSYTPKGPYRAGRVVTIKANFSEAMARQTVPLLIMSGAQTSTDNRMTRTSPTEYLYTYTVGAGDGVVTVTLDNATDLSKNVLTAAPTSGGSFVVDNTPPAVVSVTPANGAVEVSVATPIVVTFSEEMDATQAFLSGTNLTIENVSCTVTYDSNTHTATFTPTHPIAYGTDYTATLSGMKDLAGNPLPDTTWRFSTIPLYGDLKGTGEPPTIQDALLALQMAVGLVAPTPAQMQSGDIAPLVNGKPHPDGKIDISDAIVILRKVVGAVNW